MRTSRRRHFGRHYDTCLYQTMGGSNANVYIYKRARDTNKLTQLGNITVPNSASTFGIVVSPDGKHVYVCDNNTTNNLVYCYSRGTDGLLTLVGSYSTTSSASLSEGPWSVAITPDGKYVYVVNNAGSAAAIRAFSRNSNTGALSQIADNTEFTYAANAPKECCCDGVNLYVVSASTSTNALVVPYNIKSDGSLSWPGSSIGGNNLGTPRSPVLTPDGKHLYVANQTNNTLAEMVRNPGGSLGYTTQQTIATGSTPRGVVVSPDGSMVYAINNDATISVFRRNASDGSLSAASPATVAATTGGIAAAMDANGFYTGIGIDEYNVGPDGNLSKIATVGQSGGFYLALSPFNL